MTGEAGRWSQAEVEAILDEMRAGGTVMFGGSRCHTTYGYQRGRWSRVEFDEGYEQEHESSEAEIRQMVAGSPRDFAELLKAPHWRRFASAFKAGDRGEARAHLRLARAYSDPYDAGRVLDAVLAWPEQAPDEETSRIIREKLGDFTAYHVLMGVLGWGREPENGRRGVAFVDRLVEMVGPAPGSRALRATFHEVAGDIAQAVADIEAEIARAEPSNWRREGWQQQRDRLRALDAPGRG